MRIEIVCLCTTCDHEPGHGWSWLEASYVWGDNQIKCLWYRWLKLCNNCKSNLNHVWNRSTEFKATFLIRLWRHWFNLSTCCATVCITQWNRNVSDMQVNMYVCTCVFLPWIHFNHYVWTKPSMSLHTILLKCVEESARYFDWSID